MQKIQTFIWLNDQAEDAAKLYTSVIKNSKIISTMPGAGGKPMGVTVELDGREIILFNGGEQYHPTPGISFTVYCQNDLEMDHIWKKLSDGGEIMMDLSTYSWAAKYGWTNDKYGVSWQLTLSDRSESVVPSLLFAGTAQGRAEEAMNLYVSQFPDSKINLLARYEPGEPGPEGKIKFSSFTL
jgi:predicted 3-demethylubiquinone-9 3-methyltransferase (glyoxalase superfamily)